MDYRLLADLVMLAHFGFLLYLALGGFLAWRRRWLIIPHAGAAAWGVLSVAIGMACPLTAWEDRARRLAGEQGMSTGFIDTYLTGVIYPEQYLVVAQLLVAALVAISWGGFAARLIATRRASRPHSSAAHSPSCATPSPTTPS